MTTHLTNLVRAGYGSIFITTFEEDRVVNDLVAVAKQLKYEVWSWSITEGLKNGKGIPGTEDPLKMLNAFAVLEDPKEENDEPQGKIVSNKSLVILKDFHAFLRGTPSPMLVRRLKECIASGRATNRHLIILGCQLHLPPELEKEIVVVEFSLPTREELKTVAEGIASSVKQELNGNSDAILDAGSGLTTTEFADACAYSVAEKKEIDPGTVARIKADTIRKNGILEIVERIVTLDDIGGLENLKSSLFAMRNCFTKAAREYGLPSPRPNLYVGQPGTGKSLCAEATKTIFGLPLVRLEAGRLFGGTVGASEENWRRAFATAKAIAPCIVWVDEVDGLFAGAQSSGQCDGGTTARVIKAILQDLQFNAENMLFVFTANDIDGLPDPLIDRCDVWSVDLPDRQEREAIWKIHIAKRKRKPEGFNTKEFSICSEGFSGRQIEQAWVKALTVAFNNDGREPMDEDVLDVLGEFVPTSITMKDAIERRRKRLANCAKPASTVVQPKESKLKRVGRKRNCSSHYEIHQGPARMVQEPGTLGVAAAGNQASKSKEEADRMIRKIICPDCATDYKQHPEDEADGWKMRSKHITVKRPPDCNVTIITDTEKTIIPVPHLVCDFCNERLDDGAKAVAVTQWQGEEPRDWEKEYSA